MRTLSTLWHTIRDFLYPFLEEDLDPLTEKQRHFIAVCEMAELDKHMGPYRGSWLGRKKIARLDMAKAFVAKAIYNSPTTVMLIETLKGNRNLRRLCGWEQESEIPSESTFSRAFSEFAQGDLGAVVHEAMIRSRYGDKLAGHISRDSTAIRGREKATKKARKNTRKRKRGRPRKGERREPMPPKRLAVQPQRSLRENLNDLPTTCDWGTKKNSQGKKATWKGYKLHLDCVDGDIPVSAILTSASLHDSQAAIPLAQMSAGRVTNLYDLMDAAYDAGEIHDFSRRLSHVPIIDPNPRNGPAMRPLDPAIKKRYNERSAAERVNSMLKDHYGGRHVRVRGDLKVKLHLMFGVIVIAATQILRLLE